MRRALFGAMALATAGTAHAEICYGTARDAGQEPTNATVFQCPLAGARTLPQLAAAGYRIVKLLPVTVPLNGGGTGIADQLLIERAPLVFANGFEG